MLYEVKLEYLVDQIIVVYLHEDLQIKRLMMRDHINYEYALAKIKSQMPIEDKVKLADYVINNEGDFEHTASQVKSIIRRIKNEI